MLILKSNEMAVVIRNSLCSNSYPYTYSSPSVISPLILPSSRKHNHDNNQRRSYSSTIGRRRNDDNCNNNDRCNARLNAVYGYGYGYGVFRGNHHCQYLVTKASKRARSEENYDDEEEVYNREEQRWLREEQRWLREEQRWLREETRWNAERESLLRQISHLSLKIHDLELELESLRNRVGSSPTVPETLSKITALLQVLSTNANNISSTSSVSSNKNQIAEYSEETSKPLILEHTKSESESQSQLEIHDQIPPPAAAAAASMTPTATPDSESNQKAVHGQQKKKQKKSALSLKMGSEGEDVQALQEALMSLGFYSGEEDMEFSSFSSGTQRAVKTWQASIGVTEDGIVTADLLERLFASQENSGSSVNADQELTLPKQDEANGVPTASVTEVREVEQTVVKKGPTDVEVSQHRVYLLGENRWEEPSRLTKSKDKQVSTGTNGASATKCLACRGEGRLLCMECDGTGEPNIEPQFLEWVEEGTKCPYCEGLGYNVCDVCEGKAVA